MKGYIIILGLFGLFGCNKPQQAQEATLEEMILGRWVSVKSAEMTDGAWVADSGDVAGSCVMEYKPQGAVTCYWVDPDTTTRIDYSYTVDSATRDIHNTYQTHHIEELTDSTLAISYGMGITAEGDTVRGEYRMWFRREQSPR